MYMFLILFYAQQVVAQTILIDENMSDWDDIKNIPKRARRFWKWD